MKKEKGFKRILGGCLFGLCLLFAFSAKSQQIRLDNLKEQSNYSPDYSDYKKKGY